MGIKKKFNINHISYHINPRKITSGEDYLDWEKFQAISIYRTKGTLRTWETLKGRSGDGMGAPTSWGRKALEEKTDGSGHGSGMAQAELTTRRRLPLQVLHRRCCSIG